MKHRGVARVVLLLQDLKFGGTQRQSLELARRLDPGRFAPEIWLLAEGDDLALLAREWGFEPVWLSRGEGPGPAGLFRLWRRLRKSPVDLLLLLTVVPNIWGRLLGRLAGVPVIVGCCRGGGAPRRQRERWLWPLAHHIICNAQAVKAELSNHQGVPAERLTVIANGVDSDFFCPAAGPDPQAPVVLSVARLVPDKDHDTLLRAFALAAKDHPRSELWLVGEGPRRAEIQELAARLLPPGRVRFLAGQTDLRSLFHQASLLALSSVHEALPNVVLEAMASGLPVAATRVGGLPEAVVPGQTGWLVPPRDVRALAAAIGQVLGDPAAGRAFGRAGRDRVTREFSLGAMVASHQQVFQNLLARVPNAPGDRSRRE